MNSPKDLAMCEPETLHEMVGQEHARNQLITAIRSAVADQKMVDSPILMLGPGGCGKSQSAKCVATMVGATSFKTILASSIRSPGDLAALFLEQEAWSVLFIDEAAGLSDACQLAMYLALDNHKIFINDTEEETLAAKIISDINELPNIINDNQEVEKKSNL